MFILATFVGGLFRELLFMIDLVAYTFVDNVYNVFVTISLARIESDIVAQFANSAYVIISIYALFVIAKMLINTIINPDNFSSGDKNKSGGVGSIFTRLVIAIFAIVCLPIIFNFAYDVQEKILKDNLILKLILGDASIATTSNPGKELKAIAVSSLIRPEEYWAEFDSTTGQYKPSANCGNDCNNAITQYNDFLNNPEHMKILTGALIIREQSNVTKEKEFILTYTYFVVTAAGIFITYILLSFSIDMAIRVFKLGVLEITAPIFVATYVDKSEKSPFSKWIKAVTSTYTQVFFRVALMSGLIFFVSLFSPDGKGDFFGIIEQGKGEGWLVKLLLLFGVLIFFKQAPKLFEELTGIKSDGKLFGGSIKDKLGGAALIGEKTKKGMNAISGGMKRGLGSAASGFVMGAREGKGARFKTAIKQSFGGFNKGIRKGGIEGYSAKDTKGYWRKGRKEDPKSKTLGERYTDMNKNVLSNLDQLHWDSGLEKKSKNNALRSKLGMKTEGAAHNGKPVTANTFAQDPKYINEFTAGIEGTIIQQEDYDDFLKSPLYSSMSFDGKKEFQLLFQKQKQQDLQTYIEIGEKMPGLGKKMQEAIAAGATPGEIAEIQSQIDAYERQRDLILEKRYTTKDANGIDELLNPINATKIQGEAAEAISKIEKGEIEKAPAAPAP